MLDHSPENQGVQVQRVGSAHFGKPVPRTPVHREQRLPHRVHHQQQRKPGRDLGVPGHQQDRQQGDQVSEKIGAGVAQEDATAGEIPHQKAEGRGRRQERQPANEEVVHLPGDQSQRKEHHGDEEPAEPVVAVDDVDGVCNAGGRDEGEHESGSGVRHQEAVHVRDVEPQELGVQQPPAERCGHHREHQPGQDTGPPRDVFHQSDAERRQHTDDECQAGIHLGLGQPREDEQAAGQCDEDGHAAEAGHPMRVDFLNSDALVDPEPVMSGDGDRCMCQPHARDERDQGDEDQHADSGLRV